MFVPVTAVTVTSSTGAPPLCTSKNSFCPVLKLWLARVTVRTAAALVYVAALAVTESITLLTSFDLSIC